MKKTAYRFKKSIVTGSAWVRTGKQVLKSVYGKTPAPLTSLRFLRWFARFPNALAVKGKEIETPGLSLKNAFLSAALADQQIGVWSLDCDTIDFLEAKIKELRPSCVLEFGSGISTLCLAQFMRDLHGETSRPLVYSIEQDPVWVENTRRELFKHGLLQNVRIVFAPLRTQNIEGQLTSCYDLSDLFLKDFLGTDRPDLCLIDGPIAASGSRFGTIPLIHEWLSPGACCLLDDALRDAELDIGKAWSALPYLRIEGIRLIGKGLLTSTVGACRTVASPHEQKK